MFEEMKKGLLSGFGAVLVTRKNAEEATQRLVDEARLSRQEAQDFVDELFAIGSRQWSDMEASVSKTLREGVERLDIASKKGLNELRSEVEKLEKRIERLEEEIRTEKGS